MWTVESALYLLSATARVASMLCENMVRWSSVKRDVIIWKCISIVWKMSPMCQTLMCFYCQHIVCSTRYRSTQSRWHLNGCTESKTWRKNKKTSPQWPPLLVSNEGLRTNVVNTVSTMKQLIVCSVLFTLTSSWKESNIWSYSLSCLIFRRSDSLQF